MTCCVNNINKYVNDLKNKAFFFDMDGILFDSMPHHAEAWEEMAALHGLNFTAMDCYIQEGRTGQDVISHCLREKEHREPTDEEVWALYHEKTERFRAKGPVLPVAGVQQVLDYLHGAGAQIWVVTGSGQDSLLNHLNDTFGLLFARERMITAYDVEHGKPSPEPYLKAWEKSGLGKEQCFVIENAPLGVRAGKAAGLTVYAVNTGPLSDEMLYAEQADRVFHTMAQLLEYLTQDDNNTKK